MLGLAASVVGVPYSRDWTNSSMVFLRFFQLRRCKAAAHDSVDRVHDLLLVVWFHIVVGTQSGSRGSDHLRGGRDVGRRCR